jgi:hypothetical protein
MLAAPETDQLAAPGPRTVTAGTVVAVAGTVLIAATAFLPWGRSGQALRNSFELVAVAGRLELLDGAAAGGARVWFLVPVLAGLVWLAAAVGRPLLTAALSATAGSMCLAGVLLLERSPLGREPGAALAAAAAVLALCGSVLLLREWRRST